GADREVRYVGQTTQPPYDRFKQHLATARNNGTQPRDAYVLCSAFESGPTAALEFGPVSGSVPYAPDKSSWRRWTGGVCIPVVRTRQVTGRHPCLAASSFSQ
ncbi:MAG: hypothetical protein LC769_05225, partial [Chloroflexi bacterium]|nr:hypothetical protein [Chloroflexota bacterium]